MIRLADNDEREYRRCRERLEAGTDIKVLGLATISAEASSSEFHVTGYLSDQISEVILGVDFVGEHGALCDFAESHSTVAVIATNTPDIRRMGATCHSG